MNAVAMLTGTQNPFNYDANGERIYSKSEELQYGNSIRGVDEIYLKIDIVTEPGNDFMYDEHGNPVLMDTDNVLDIVESSDSDFVNSSDSDLVCSLRKRIKQIPRLR